MAARDDDNCIAATAGGPGKATGMSGDGYAAKLCHSSEVYAGPRGKPSSWGRQAPLEPSGAKKMKGASWRQWLPRLQEAEKEASEARK